MHADKPTPKPTPTPTPTPKQVIVDNDMQRLEEIIRQSIGPKPK